MTAATVLDRVSQVDQAAPEGAPVFFMHIAKTAGSYVNSVLEDALGSSSVALHVEHWLGNTADLARRLNAGTRLFSGHVMNGLWDDISGPLNTPFRKVTILREPHEHLASHLQWLDHYNRPDMRAGYRALDEAHQRVVDRIATVDLTDAGQLDCYLTSLGATEVRLFDNCQSRYFLETGRRGVEGVQPLTLASAKSLRIALKSFDLVLRQDRLDEDVKRLGDLLGVPLHPPARRINAGRSLRRVDTKSPVVRAILSKRTLLDQWLWREVTQ